PRGDRLHRARRGRPAGRPDRGDVPGRDLGHRARGRGPRRAGHDDGRLHRRGRPRGGGLRSRPHHRLAARRRRSDRVNSLTVDATAQGAAPGVGGGGTDSPPPPTTTESRWNRTVHKIIRGNVLVVVMSFVFAFLIGSLLIVIADAGVREAAGYFFDQPSDTLIAVWQSIIGAYTAMFRAAVLYVSGPTAALPHPHVSGTYVILPALAAGLRPLTETLPVATPLIIASAGMAVSFRAGLFNIGGTGQLIVGAMAAGYIGFSWDLPVGIHLLVALLAGTLAGAVWGGIAG